MSDDFYGPFDRDYLRNESNPERRQDYRSVFHQDRDRLMFTSSFRRLQAKTQVFQAGEYDFYRTRLTHSLEVSRIAESIAIWLRGARPEVRIDLHLLECICLAHDIGHPPFGHAGERALNQVMEPYGGFEGNAQTLRILTRTIYSGSQRRSGMSPSRALLDGVLKYKQLHRDRGEATHHFIYDDQADVLEFCFGSGDLSGKLDTVEVNRFQSLECQIMDLADDVAYSCFDIVDGAKARFLTADKVARWRDEKGARLDAVQRKTIDELLDMMAKSSLERKMNGIIGELIQTASLAPADNFMTSQTRRHAYTLVRQPEAEAHIKLNKALSRDLVYGSSALQQIEYKGGHILKQLAQTLFDNYLGMSTKPAALVPDEVHRTVLNAKTKTEGARLLCDHLSGMTDAYALRSYKRLLDPDYGSISELIYMASPSPFIVVPTYHERDNLPRFTWRLWHAVPNARLLLVDDASGDGTPDWVRAHAKYNKSLFLLERAGKLGLGSAYLAGFDWVIKRHATEPCSAVVQMDADLSHSPDSVPELLQALDAGADLVLATRYRQGVRVTNWPLHRLMLSLGAGKYVQWITRMPFTDPTGGFKAFRPDKLATLDLSQVRSDGYAFQIEVTYMAWRLGWKIEEVPIVFEDRYAGTSKMSARIVREAIWRVPWLAMRGKVSPRAAATNGESHS